ncbi:hypothetical protein N657DRAFT_644722 [Parathielavia appendiculata]|uniref:Kinetochore protein mis14 n=1 Tax=Parathielavia appendiculata TaxID=2587402 RepID=A0AAN6U1J7_9PEZI|nr:hypothetical protein N657DRAFT_644722 [Parathielavia appendiculata]
MDPAAHRRIELQSPEDLTYLVDNVRRAAADSINTAFPPVDNLPDGQEDELRNRIEQLVNDYILKTFTLAAPNLTINGLPLSNPAALLTPSSSNDRDPATQQRQPRVHYEYEPFDPRKRDRIEQLISEEEDLLRSIALLKRRAPQATAARWSDATRAGIDADEELLKLVCERVAEEGSVSGKKALEGMGPLERQEDVEGRWDEAVAGLGRLKRDMPAAVAKMERARVAAGYVSGGR